MRKHVMHAQHLTLHRMQFSAFFETVYYKWTRFMGFNFQFDKFSRFFKEVHSYIPAVFHDYKRKSLSLVVTSSLRNDNQLPPVTWFGSTSSAFIRWMKFYAYIGFLTFTAFSNMLVTTATSNCTTRTGETLCFQNISLWCDVNNHRQ